METIILSLALLLGSDAIHPQHPETVIMDRSDHIETINTLEDMVEWMQADVENGKINSSVGEDYVDNISDVILVLKNRTIIIENEN